MHAATSTNQSAFARFRKPNIEDAGCCFRGTLTNIYEKGVSWAASIPLLILAIDRQAPQRLDPKRLNHERARIGATTGRPRRRLFRRQGLAARPGRDRADRRAAEADPG